MKEHLEKIINGEKKWYQMVETDAVHGPVEIAPCIGIVKAKQKMKSGKATGPSEVIVEIIVASGKIGV